MNLYDNKEGHTNESLHISSKVECYVKSLLEEYSEYNALELCGLISGAVTNAFCVVSIERRLA